MSSTEFVRWKGFLRQSPYGGAWLNRQFAELKREIAKARPWKDGKMPALDHYLWQPPKSLFGLRKRAEAKAKRERAAAQSKRKT